MMDEITCSMTLMSISDSQMYGWQKIGVFFGSNLLWHMAIHFDQGGKGEVVGQLSCIDETITTKILKKLKIFFIYFLELSEKNKFWKKKSLVKWKYH